jgi:hypothetical protein
MVKKVLKENSECVKNSTSTLRRSERMKQREINNVNNELSVKNKGVPEEIKTKRKYTKKKIKKMDKDNKKKGERKKMLLVKNEDNK